MKIKKFSKKPTNIKSRVGAKPVICYPNEKINDNLKILHEARKYIKQYSYREVANWLSKNTGRNISHMGLRKRLMHEKQRKNKATSILKWADYAKKAIQKAEELSTKRTSAYKKTEDRISS